MEEIELIPVIIILLCATVITYQKLKLPVLRLLVRFCDKALLECERRRKS